MKRYLFTGTCVLLFAFSSLFAGLETPTADISVTNLRIGETYNLTQLGNMPFRVKANNIGYKVNISLLTPKPGQTISGYEPIPDITWITLSKYDFTLLAGETGAADITIKIPNDEALLGKQYEAWIWARTLLGDEIGGTVGIAVAVMGKLRFTIAPRPPTEEELRQIRNTKVKLINISLVPNDLMVENVPLGRKVSAEKHAGKFLKLVNTSNEPITMSLGCIPVSSTGIQAPQGWEEGPDTSIIKFKKSKVKVKPLEIKKIDFTINFPNNSEMSGKKYMFVVEAVTEGEIITTNYRSKIYITTSE
ncbi:MAG: hypothetical protein JW803_08810 [Endomicrobiales bacterium]|nr:hypothetical protein [Endomicrobiales bacterium]